MILLQLIEIICLKTMGEVIYSFFQQRKLVYYTLPEGIIKFDACLSMFFLPSKTFTLQYVINILTFNIKT